MKKLMFTLLAGAMLLASTSVNAQEKNGFKFGLGLEGALPVSGFAGYDVGGGLSIRLSQGVADKIDVTLTSGVIAFVPKDITVGTTTLDTKASIFIPIKAGARYMLSKNFYGMAEAGVTITKVYFPTVTGTTGSVSSVSGSSFTYAPGVGARFGGLDIGLRYEGVDGSGFMGLRLGYDF